MGRPSYTYDPTRAAAGGVDQMRFELGDVMVEGGPDTCALTDEEYKAIIDACPKRWKRAKLRCIESILFRFSYEVDTKVDELSLSLSQRLDAWKRMRDELKAELEASAPFGNPHALSERHYFHVGMMENRRSGGTEGGPPHVSPPGKPR